MYLAGACFGAAAAACAFLEGGYMTGVLVVVTMVPPVMVGTYLFATPKQQNTGEHKARGDQPTRQG